MLTSFERIRSWWDRRSPRVQFLTLVMGTLGLYTLVTLIATWPIVTCLSTCVAGDPSGDQPIGIWGLWHGKESLLKGQNPAFIATLNYPHGYFSPVRLAILTVPIIMFPLELLFPPIVVYNLAFMLSFVLTGYAGFLLCHDITKDRRGALLGGTILMLFPLRVAHALAGHIEIACLFIPVIYVILLRRTGLNPSYRLAFFTGLALALASMSFVTTTPYFLIPWTVMYLGGLILSRREQFRNRSTWLALGLAGLVAIIITLPFFIPLIQAALHPNGEMLAYGVSTYSADLLGYISPPPGNPILDRLGLIPAFARNAKELQETTAYLGLIPVSLTVFALLRRVHESRIWLTVAFITMVFALGPVLRVGGTPVRLDGEGSKSLIFMPYIALMQLPIFSIGREPGRLNLITGMVLSVLAAQGVTVWLQKQHGWRSTVVLTVLTAGVIAEYLVGWPIEVTREGLFPPTVEVLSKEPPTGGVINVPLRNYWTKLWSAYYQIEHGWPIFGGSYARDIPDIPGRLEMLDWITTSTKSGDIIPAISRATSNALLAQEGADYILLHHYNVEDAPEVESHLISLFGKPVATDPAISLYKVQASSEAIETLYALGQTSGWGEIEEWEGEPTRWLTKNGDLVIYSPQDVTGILSFRSMAGDHPRHLTITSETGEPHTLVIAQYMNYVLSNIELQAGYNVLNFDVEEPCWSISTTPECAIGQSLTSFSPSEKCSSPPHEQRCIDVLFQTIRFEPNPE